MPKHLTPVPHEEIDTANTDPAYWETILKREGLGMQRGLHPHVYVGSPVHLEEHESGAPLKNVKQHHATVDLDESAL